MDHILKNARRIRDTTHRPQVAREAQTVYPLYDIQIPVHRNDYVFLLQIRATHQKDYQHLLFFQINSYESPPQRSVVFHKTYDLVLRWHILMKKIPKAERYTIGQKTFEYLLEILTLITKAEYFTTTAKIDALTQANHTLAVVKILVRLSHSLDIIQEWTYIELEEHLNQIGTMLGGWIRFLSKKTYHPATRDDMK